MVAAVSQAASAYANALKRAQGASGGDDNSGGPSFGDLVKGAITDAVGTQKEAEKQAVMGAARKSDLLDVASAINNAEMTLQSVVSIRDKVISAYQEVIRMPI